MYEHINIFPVPKGKPSALALSVASYHQEAPQRGKSKTHRLS